MGGREGEGVGGGLQMQRVREEIEKCCEIRIETKRKTDRQYKTCTLDFLEAIASSTIALSWLAESLDLE